MTRYARGGRRFDLTIALNYYAPYVSGVTEVARVLAEGLAARGWRVAVVTSHHDHSVPTRERRNGVEVFRCPVAARVGRGVLSPGFPMLAGRIARDSAVANLHLPMLEAGLVARLAGTTPVVSTYHIDLWVPPGPLSRLQIRSVDMASRAALRRSAAVVVNSDDQARHSKLWPVIDGRNWHAVPPPCVDRRGGRPVYRRGNGLHVGFLGRIVEDKGLEYLVRGFRRITNPEARLMIGGEYERVAGGGIIDVVRRAAGDDPRVHILGPLSGTEINDFYASIDVFALPSVAESFGIVQAEAMMAGIPCVTSDLPGGRHPVVATGFGLLVPPRDPSAITHALLSVAETTPERRVEGGLRARSLFNAGACLDAYEHLFRSGCPRPSACGLSGASS